MVTRRARTWIQRGVTAAVILAVTTAGASAWFTAGAIDDFLLRPVVGRPLATPAQAGIPHQVVNVPGPLGNYPAWLVEGRGDTWVLLVHDLRGSQAQTLGLLRVAVEQGLPSLVITTRNGFGAPPADGGRSALGADEWQDLEAAMAFAVESGAETAVIVGYGSGAATALAFLRRSDEADRVVGVVLDSPYLDPGAMVDAFTASGNVPGFVSGWGKAVATLRWGVDWALLDQVAAAADLATPILLIQGTGDRRAPVGVADAFAAARPGLVEYVRVAGAGHLEAERVDPEKYRNAVRRFLGRVAAGGGGCRTGDTDPAHPGHR